MKHHENWVPILRTALFRAKGGETMTACIGIPGSITVAGSERNRHLDRSGEICCCDVLCD